LLDICSGYEANAAGLIDEAKGIVAVIDSGAHPVRRTMQSNVRQVLGVPLGHSTSPPDDSSHSGGDLREASRARSVLGGRRK
jgi:hypothetical protein